MTRRRSSNQVRRTRFISSRWPESISAVVQGENRRRRWFVLSQRLIPLSGTRALVFTWASRGRGDASRCLWHGSAFQALCDAPQFLSMCPASEWCSFCILIPSYRKDLNLSNEALRDVSRWPAQIFGRD